MSDEMNENKDLNIDLNAKTEETKKYLTFMSDGLIFGVKADFVTEIITNHSITKLPTVPNFIKGIINLRGQIIPIIDIRLRMNKPEAEDYGSSCIIVLNINSISIGILVDTVLQVVDVYESQISPLPANNKQELLYGMISLSENIVMLVLDCQLLITNN